LSSIPIEGCSQYIARKFAKMQAVYIHEKNEGDDRSIVLQNERSALLNKPAAAESPRTDASVALVVHDDVSAELFGLGLMALSVVFSSLQTLLVRFLSVHQAKHSSSTPFPSFELAFARAAVQLLLAALVLAAQRVKHKLYSQNESDCRAVTWRAHLWLVVRGVAGFAGMSFLYGSLSKLSLAEATIIFFTAPLLTALIAALFLGESLTLFYVGACATSLLAVALITLQPVLGSSSSVSLFASSAHVLGACYAFLAALSVAIAYVIIRGVGSSASFVLSVFYFALVSTVCSPVAMFAFQTPRLPASAAEAVLLSGIGVSGFLGNALLTIGLQNAHAAPATLMRYLEVPASFFWGWLLLDERPSPPTLTAAAVIIAVAAALASRTWRASARSRTTAPA